MHRKTNSRARSHWQYPLPGTTVTVPANAFNGLAVINTGLTIGDRLSDMKAIATHSNIFGEALKNKSSMHFSS